MPFNIEGVGGSGRGCGHTLTPTRNPKYNPIANDMLIQIVIFISSVISFTPSNLGLKGFVQKFMGAGSFPAVYS